MMPGISKSPLVMLQNAGNSNFTIIYMSTVDDQTNHEPCPPYFLKHVKYPSTLKEESGTCVAQR